MNKFIVAILASMALSVVAFANDEHKTEEHAAAPADAAAEHHDAGMEHGKMEKKAKTKKTKKMEKHEEHKEEATH